MAKRDTRFLVIDPSKYMFANLAPQLQVIIPGEKSFFETGMPDASCDVVISQEALLHAGSERHKALREAARVLKPGGRLVFSDIMQSEEADPKDLQEVSWGYTDRDIVMVLHVPHLVVVWGSGRYRCGRCRCHCRRHFRSKYV